MTEAREKGRPTLALDLFSDAAIRDPQPGYRAIRDCAPAVWLLLRAVVARVERIEVGEPRTLMSNMLHGYESFATSFH